MTNSTQIFPISSEFQIPAVTCCMPNVHTQVHMAQLNLPPVVTMMLLYLPLSFSVFWDGLCHQPWGHQTGLGLNGQPGKMLMTRSNSAQHRRKKGSCGQGRGIYLCSAPLRVVRRGGNWGKERLAAAVLENETKMGGRAFRNLLVNSSLPPSTMDSKASGLSLFPKTLFFSYQKKWSICSVTRVLKASMILSYSNYTSSKIFRQFRFTFSHDLARKKMKFLWDWMWQRTRPRKEQTCLLSTSKSVSHKALPEFLVLAGVVNFHHNN